MDEQKIIINNVDVSECEFFEECEIKINDSECLAHSRHFYEGTFYDCCDEHPDCYYKQLKRKEQECEQLRNKLNSSIERMNAQNEKLHNENKELKSYIKEDLVPHVQIYIGLINRIKQQMKTILMVKTSGKYRPVKNSTKEQCYQILGNIQELLKTNIITIGIKE